MLDVIDNRANKKQNRRQRDNKKTTRTSQNGCEFLRHQSKLPFMSKASFTKATLSAIILDHLDKALTLRATAHKFGRETLCRRCWVPNLLWMNMVSAASEGAGGEGTTGLLKSAKEAVTLPLLHWNQKTRSHYQRWWTLPSLEPHQAGEGFHT